MTVCRRRRRTRSASTRLWASWFGSCCSASHTSCARALWSRLDCGAPVNRCPPAKRYKREVAALCVAFNGVQAS